MKFSTKLILALFLSSTIAVGSYVIPNLSITTAKIAALAVTRPKLAAVGQQISNALSAQGTASATYIDITNMTINLTTTGRPVYVAVQSDGTGSAAYFQINNTASAFSTGIGFIRFVRDATPIADYAMNYLMPGVTSSTFITYPASFSYIDVPAAGTYNYKAQFKAAGDVNQQLSANNIRLVAYEL